MNSGECQYQSLLQEIELHGWVVMENLIPEELSTAMLDEIRQLEHDDELNRAAIGRELDEHVNDRIRGDYIAWFDESSLSETQRRYQQELNQLMAEFNRHFFMGLVEQEIMYAVYPGGNFYARHLDQHKDSDTRVITVITYLNPQWDETKGGQLRLYLQDGSYRDVVPHAGTTVCFLCTDFEHEVLAATEPRYSVTGWLRRRIV